MEDNKKEKKPKKTKKVKSEDKDKDKKKTKKVKSDEPKKEKKPKKQKKDDKKSDTKDEPAQDNKHVEAAQKWIKSSKNKQHIAFVKHISGKNTIQCKIGDEELVFDIVYPVEAEDVWVSLTGLHGISLYTIN
jgi:hypothetical protein